jgi:elongation factor Ts
VTSANIVKDLRDRTGAGIMECKRALQETQNDLEKAIEYLRKKGLAAAAKRQGKVTKEGRVHSYIHGQGKLGVLVEINCETDFVANTDEFKQFVHDVAMHVAAANPRYLTSEVVPQVDLDKEKEIYRAQAEASGKKGPVIDKIVEGKIGKFYEEACLMQQKFVKDPDKSIELLTKELIAKLGENITINRFVRFQLGEMAKAEESQCCCN